MVEKVATQKIMHDVSLDQQDNGALPFFKATVTIYIQYKDLLPYFKATTGGAFLYFYTFTKFW